jgi:hypothetical protein
MHPDKEFCAICDGVGVLGCNFQSGPLCKAGRKAGPQCIDFDTRAKSAGYIKLQPGQVVVDKSDVAEVLNARLCARETPATTISALRLRVAITNFDNDDDSDGTPTGARVSDFVWAIQHSIDNAYNEFKGNKKARRDLTRRLQRVRIGVLSEDKDG